MYIMKLAADSDLDVSSIWSDFFVKKCYQLKGKLPLEVCVLCDRGTTREADLSPLWYRSRKGGSSMILLKILNSIQLYGMK